MSKRKVDAGSFEVVEQDLLNYLDALGKVDRLEKINDLLYRLNFERRVTELTDEELADMNNVSLSPLAMKKLDKAKTKKERDEYFTEFARSLYFRNCDWISFLHGESNEKPFTSTSSG